jgi:hypothetical protein
VFPIGGRDLLERAGEIVELAVRAGDTVVVTETGAERLGRRSFGFPDLLTQHKA